MGIVFSSGTLAVGSGKTAHSAEFTIPARREHSVLVAVVRDLKEGAHIDLGLEEHGEGAWKKSAAIEIGGSRITNGVHYAHVARHKHPVRVALKSSDAGHVDVFVSDGVSDNPWGSMGHRLDKLGAGVAAEIPRLQQGLEQTLLGVMTLEGRSTGKSKHAAASNAPSTGPRAHLSTSLLQYMLGNRIEHADVPAAAVKTIASSIKLTDAQLRDHIDHLNALSDVGLHLVGTGTSTGGSAGGGTGTAALTICGFWSTHIDPGPCQTNPQGDTFSVCTVTDVDACNTVDVHY